VDFSWTQTGLTVVFTNLTTGPGTWAWDFGDGQGSTKRNVTYTYGAAGTYRVTLTLTRDGVNTSASHDVTVTGP
jgi:PKD repeat protein